MKPKYHTFYQGRMFSLDPNKSITLPKANVRDHKDLVRIVLGDGAGFIDHNDDMWLEVDFDGYYSTYQMVKEAEKVVDKKKLH